MKFGKEGEASIANVKAMSDALREGEG